MNIGEGIDKNEFLNLIKDLDKYSQRMYIKLFKNYNLLNKKAELSHYNNKYNYGESLRNYFDYLEDKIYTVDGKVISQNDRILFELKNILKCVMKNENITDDLKKEVVIELDHLSKLYIEDKCNTPEMYQYFKEKISMLQALLGLDIKFFFAAYKFFVNKYMLLDIVKNEKNINYKIEKDKKKNNN